MPTITRIGQVLVAKRRTVVTFELAFGRRVSKRQPGRETQNCRTFGLASGEEREERLEEGGERREDRGEEKREERGDKREERTEERKERRGRKERGKDRGERGEERGGKREGREENGERYYW